MVILFPFLFWLGGSLAYNLLNKSQSKVHKSEEAYNARIGRLEKEIRECMKLHEQKEKERALNLKTLEKEFREYTKLQEQKERRTGSIRWWIRLFVVILIIYLSLFHVIIFFRPPV